jgi:hypothetical protein
MCRMSSSRKKSKDIKSPGPNQCHPSIGSTRPAIGCFPREVLEKVAKKLNLNPASGNAIRKQIEKELDLEQKGERTFLMELPLSSSEKTSLSKKYLRPQQPEDWLKDDDKWLDSNNISAVMNQYEEAFPEFEFMGPFPIDFGAPNPYKTGPTNTSICLMNEICTLSVKESIKNGTKYIGVVYNLDPHYKSGSHWVANFIDLDKKVCVYFDSYGMKPPHQVEKFMKWLTTHDSDFKLHYSSRRLQYKNTECGMYCLYMIILMLDGCSLVDITRRHPSDTDMLKFRSWLYST